MWLDWVLPRLRPLGLGAEVVQTTYRLAGIGESMVADVLGDAFLRTTNPIVATYARQDAVDVRISARSADGPHRGGARVGRRRPRSGHGSATTSGRPARRPGPRRSGRAWRSSAGRSPRSRWARAGRSSTCWGPWRGWRQPRSRTRAVRRARRCRGCDPDVCRGRRGPGRARPPAGRRHRREPRDRHAERVASRIAGRLPDRRTRAQSGRALGGRHPPPTPPGELTVGRRATSAPGDSAGGGPSISAAGDPGQARQVEDRRSRPAPAGAAGRRRRSRAACSRSGGSPRSSRRGRSASAGRRAAREPSAAAVPCPAARWVRRAASRPVMSRKWSSWTWVVRRRSSAASAASSASRSAGSLAMSSRKRARARASVSVGSRAVAVAERGAPSRSASSPKKSPALTVAMIASSPSSDGRLIFTAPRRHDEQRLPGIALVEEDLAAPEPARAHLPGEADQVVAAEAREERAPGERRDDGVLVDRGNVHLRTVLSLSARAPGSQDIRPDPGPPRPVPVSAGRQSRRRRVAPRATLACLTMRRMTSPSRSDSRACA